LTSGITDCFDSYATVTYRNYVFITGVLETSSNIIKSALTKQNRSDLNEYGLKVFNNLSRNSKENKCIIKSRRNKLFSSKHIHYFMSSDTDISAGNHEVLILPSNNKTKKMTANKIISPTFTTKRLTHKNDRITISLFTLGLAIFVIKYIHYATIDLDFLLLITAPLYSKLLI